MVNTDTLSAAGRAGSDWPRDAACSGMDDPEQMWPPSADDPSVAEARKVCGRCPVRLECRLDAIRKDEWEGTRGGHTTWERKGLRLLGLAPALWPDGPVWVRNCTDCDGLFLVPAAHPWTTKCPQCTSANRKAGAKARVAKQKAVAS